MRRIVPWLMAGLFIAVITLAGCSASDPLVTPPDIDYGGDICHRCGMIIDDERFASAYVTEAGQVFLFDDPGEMFRARQEEGVSVARYWVHDFSTREWIDGQAALYVRGESIQSPMGFGIAAFGDPAEAERFAANSGATAMSFEAAVFSVMATVEQPRRPSETPAHGH